MNEWILVFLRFFVFELRARTERTDGRTGKTHNTAYNAAA